jgi:uncharacterized protein
MRLDLQQPGEVGSPPEVPQACPPAEVGSPSAVRRPPIADAPATWFEDLWLGGAKTVRRMGQPRPRLQDRFSPLLAAALRAQTSRSGHRSRAGNRLLSHPSNETCSHNREPDPLPAFSFGPGPSHSFAFPRLISLPIRVTVYPVTYAVASEVRIVPFQKLVFCLMLSLPIGSIAKAGGTDDLYTSRTIVTGTRNDTRIPGLRDCLKRVLVRVSGDQRLLERPKMEEVLGRAGELARTVRYQDRLAGVPIHDEQGTYDRPHNLICEYDREAVDRVLDQFGSRPWLGPRPVLAVVLEVQRGADRYRVERDGMRDQAMRDSFALAADRMAIKVVFPSGENLALAGLSFRDLAARAGADIPLSGTLEWSDAALGWIVTWTLRDDLKTHRWEAQGVNFDEAFRVGVRGAAQILSGNGDP